MNSDDFGYSRVFNERILDLLETGRIHSTTVLVNRITKDQKNQINRIIKVVKRGKVGVGVHLEISPKKSLKRQIEQQYKKFISIFGFEPSHFDLHISKRQHDEIYAHLREIISAIDAFALSHDLAIRHVCSNEVLKNAFKHKARTTTAPVFTCTWLGYDQLARYVSRMKDGKSYELLFHVGEYDPSVKTSLNAERKEDYDNAIKLQRLIKSHKNMENVSFRDL